MIWKAFKRHSMEVFTVLAQQQGEKVRDTKSAEEIISLNLAFSLLTRPHSLFFYVTFKEIVGYCELKVESHAKMLNCIVDEFPDGWFTTCCMLFIYWFSVGVIGDSANNFENSQLQKIWQCNKYLKYVFLQKLSYAKGLHLPWNNKKLVSSVLEERLLKRKLLYVHLSGWLWNNCCAFELLAGGGQRTIFKLASLQHHGTLAILKELCKSCLLRLFLFEIVHRHCRSINC